MKETKLFPGIMHFLVHNGFLFTVSVMGLVHAVLLVIMCISGVTPLIWFNSASVLVYAVSIFLCMHGRIIPVYSSILLEVTAYSIISTYFVGLQCGTVCFLFSIVPVMIYFGCYLFRGKQRWCIVAILLFLFGAFSYTYIRFSDSVPIYELQKTERFLLTIFSAFVMTFSIIFYNVIYIYSSEMMIKNMEERNKELSVAAHEDSLTHLLNRHGFLSILDQLADNTDTEKYCIAFCDIDDFKKVNDSYGHDAGDEVLKHITQLMKRELGEYDICRWGGEEIVILLRDSELYAVKDKMETLRKSIAANPTVYLNRRIFVTITIGLAANIENCEAVDDVIKTADVRMYYGKKNGKNKVICEDRVTL